MVLLGSAKLLTTENDLDRKQTTHTLFLNAYIAHFYVYIMTNYIMSI